MNRPPFVLLAVTGAILALGGGRLIADGVNAKEAALTPRAIPKIRGEEVEKSVAQLLDRVAWHRDLDHALALAKEERKPVFWLHLVGELDDGL